MTDLDTDNRGEPGPRFIDRLRKVGVVPVVTLADEAEAVALARALVAGGLDVIEVTLRTPAAMAALSAIAREVPEAYVGAGTVVNERQFEDAIDAGARFIVSPGSSPQLIRAAEGDDVPWIPAVATVSEIIGLLDQNFRLMKFFPAAVMGGVAWLSSVAPLFQNVMFCPTGGITAENARTYLDQPNVACVGGSWVAPAKAIAEGRFEEITALAKAARALREQG